MALMDWSDPHKTPREPFSRPVSGDGGPPRGRADAELSPASAHPLTGSLADYDDLTQALAAYEAGCTFGGQTGPLYGALMDASFRCGRPFGTPALGWSTRRVNTYRNMIGA